MYLQIIYNIFISDQKYIFITEKTLRATTTKPSNLKLDKVLFAYLQVTNGYRENI